MLISNFSSAFVGYNLILVSAISLLSVMTFVSVTKKITGDETVSKGAVALILAVTLGFNLFFITYAMSSLPFLIYIGAVWIIMILTSVNGEGRGRAYYALLWPPFYGYVLLTFARAESLIEVLSLIIVIIGLSTMFLMLCTLFARINKRG